ncbi:AraC family transcriptional regulator [uncultured Tateyamaria sp.]|uniref:helix-turn-helix domain-containing protein n=1 Tax=uncultured Tateyamaria sp. TaxID=455651 RepID=UPI0026342A22|nr:AraC family transcriptional regulator [uncultured Tateyamaria sp.]
MNKNFEDKIIIDRHYSLSCVQPGSQHLELKPDQYLVDIYLSGSKGRFSQPPCAGAPQTTIPNSFNFLPCGTTDVYSTVRNGLSVRFVFELNAIRIIPAREALRDCTTAMWNQLDVAMLGAAEITKGYLQTPNHSVKNVETSFLRDLLAVRMLQILSQTTFDETSVQSPSIQRSIEFIDANLSAPLHLDHISQHVNISQHHFARMFRSAMGISIRHYVIKRRVEAAERMISQTDTSLAEIAYATGFSSQSHMTTVFRRVTGRTPATYRTMLSRSAQTS